MELRQLRYFRAVCEAGGFAKAALALEASQSNLSAQVAALERELGAQLLRRVTHGVEPTPAGAILLETARAVEDRLQAAAREVEALASGRSGTARIGLIGTLVALVTKAFLERMSSAHPGVALTLTEGATTTLERDLAVGHLDVALINLPVSLRSVRTKALFVEELVAVLPADRAGRGELRLAELAERPWLLPGSENALRGVIEAACERAGFRPRVVYEYETIRLVEEAMHAVRGVTLLPAAGVVDRLPAGFAVRRVADAPSRVVGLGWFAERPVEPPAAEAMAVLEDVVRRGVGQRRPGLRLL
ncbi:LysR family transcriptional regulator [bacterium]|nr:MAG: LysR family transcriptional regulator [bacterium]